MTDAQHRRAVSDLMALFHASDLGERIPPETIAGSITYGEIRTLRREYRELRADRERLEVLEGQCEQLARERGALQFERDQLKAELADLRPYAEAGKQLAAKQAESEYYHGTCDGCSCCTTAQCRENRCPENSIGDSTCPCTCD